MTTHHLIAHHEKQKAINEKILARLLLGQMSITPGTLDEHIQRYRDYVTLHNSTISFLRDRVEDAS
ncbi:hypothetical protein [Terriglobus roseus]|uniref:Uncharacterized protein n=1 Tax=Terriglobus roseus TaxID=392734 RepID=A0A1H4K6L3_9BACT|nr:hypothetical protein [Terriglobus roseus]SEB53946.1 hypothetical protein SAMN05443244_1026 [Terriglobus roseus]